MSIYIYVCLISLVTKSYKLLIGCCIYKVMFVRVLELLTYDVYLHYLSKKVVFIQLLRLCGVYLLHINCWIYRKCNLTVVKTCSPYRWPSGAQVERGLVGMRGIVGWASGGLRRVVFEWRRSNIGLCSFRCCSGMSSLLWWNDWIYICLYGSKRVGVLICLRRVIVSSMLPYSCLQVSICSAYAERGSLFFMYRVCSRNLDFKFRLVCPIYALWQVLHVIFYIPLFSCSCDYCVLIFIELYFSNFGPLTCFNVMIPEAV